MPVPADWPGTTLEAFCRPEGAAVFEFLLRVGVFAAFFLRAVDLVGALRRVGEEAGVLRGAGASWRAAGEAGHEAGVSLCVAEPVVWLARSRLVPAGTLSSPLDAEVNGNISGG